MITFIVLTETWHIITLILGVTKYLTGYLFFFAKKTISITSECVIISYLSHIGINLFIHRCLYFYIQFFAFISSSITIFEDKIIFQMCMSIVADVSCLPMCFFLYFLNYYGSFDKFDGKYCLLGIHKKKCNTTYLSTS